MDYDEAAMDIVKDVAFDAWRLECAERMLKEKINITEAEVRESWDRMMRISFWQPRNRRDDLTSMAIKILVSMERRGMLASKRESV